MLSCWAWGHVGGPSSPLGGDSPGLGQVTDLPRTVAVKATPDESLRLERRGLAASCLSSQSPTHPCRTQEPRVSPAILPQTSPQHQRSCPQGAAASARNPNSQPVARGQRLPAEGNTAPPRGTRGPGRGCAALRPQPPTWVPGVGGGSSLSQAGARAQSQTSSVSLQEFPLTQTAWGGQTGRSHHGVGEGARPAGGDSPEPWGHGPLLAVSARWPRAARTGSSRPVLSYFTGSYHPLWPRPFLTQRSWGGQGTGLGHPPHRVI